MQRSIIAYFFGKEVRRNVKNPSISVVIVNWNHGFLLRSCLEALLAQKSALFDITVVDNGSQDGSAEEIGVRYPSVQLRAFPDNRGFSRAFNWGVNHTTGDFVLSLNPDVIVRSGFILEMAKAMCRDEQIGLVAPKLLRADAPALLDSTGLFVDRRRRPYDRGQCEPDRGQYDKQLCIFGACGAAALYRRTMLEDLALNGEYFDQDFFAYYEDADLAWRAQSRRWCAVYEPSAVATHDRGWGDALRKTGRAAKGPEGPRLSLRNRYLMTVKNDNLAYFLADLPLILAAELPRLAYAALVRPQVLLGIPDMIRVLPSALAKRRRIRSRRIVEDAIVRRWFMTPLEAAGSGNRY
jgi:GT2 family glycosyltransferase